MKEYKIKNNIYISSKDFYATLGYNQTQYARFCKKYFINDIDSYILKSKNSREFGDFFVNKNKIIEIILKLRISKDKKTYLLNDILRKNNLIKEKEVNLGFLIINIIKLIFIYFIIYQFLINGL